MNKVFCVAGCLFFSLGVIADEKSADYPFYATASVARAFGEVDAQDMNNRMAALGYQANAKVYGQDRNAWDAALGYRMTNYLDLQLGYSDLGKVKTRLSGNALDIENYLNSANLVHPRSADGLTLALRGRYYLNDDFYLYGRVGLIRADSVYFADARSDQATRTKKENSNFFGIGYEYEWAPRWSFHLGGDIYRIEGESIKVLNMGLAYKFGSKPRVNEPPLNPIKSEATANVAQPVAPAIEPVAQPMPLEIELAIIFDTDSAVIKPEFFSEVERLAIFMTANAQVKIVLEGHTDDRGNNQYNQALSQRRVDAVKQLLIDRYEINTSRLTATGFGEDKPIADNTSLSGREQNRRVVARVVD